MAKCCLRFALVLAFVSMGACWATAADGRVDFNRQIRPILSDNCFACHGPDDAARKARLRLDRHEDVFKPARSGERPIVPGDAASSEVLARMLTRDEDDVMPPPSTGKKLTVAQIELVRRWIEEGAEWQSHWAFVQPAKPSPPVVEESSWPRNDIDRFILDRLEKEGLKPSPQADKTSLIRRASLDLTGLPPTVEEVDAFLADGSPDAYEQLVDRLLNWERFGEHQARYWLDAVRYADTHGYHIDARRDLWKYRDWVIDALNQNKPFDQFTTEQLAGDLLPEPTLDQKIATGYLRANMTTGEGGAIEDEYRAKYTFDRTETTGTIFMGMTLTCARCHTHKYDPIQHEEYFGLYDFFNQLAEPVMDQNKPNPEPFLKVPSPEQAQRMDWLKQHIDKGQAQIDAAIPELDASQVEWQRDWTARVSKGWLTLQPARASSAVTNGAQLRLLEDGYVLAEGPSPEGDVHELIFRPEPGTLGALRLEIPPANCWSRNGPGRADDGTFALAQVEIELTRPAAEGGEKPKAEKLKIARAVADAESKEHEIGRVLDGKNDTSWRIAADSVTEPHAALFVLGKPVKIEPGSEIKLRLRHGTGKADAALAHYRVSAAASEALVQLLHPPSFVPWQVVGPLEAGDARALLAKSYAPENAIDLKQKFPGVREEVGWSERQEFADGKSHLLVQDLHGIHGVRYLYRTITMPDERRLPLDIKADGLFRLWVNDELVAERDQEPTPGNGPLTVTVQLKKGENRFLLKIVTVQGASYFTFRPDLSSPDTLTPEIAAILAASSNLTAANEGQVRNYYRRQYSAEFREIFDHVVRWREELEETDRAVPTTLIAKESEKQRDTFLLNRGEYDQKGEKVLAHVPAIFPPLPPGAPTNRLGLAQWLLEPSHPLTARVTVNRLWQQYFGTGLVKTSEDFGLQGESPSHPELLDWLATEFIGSGWNLKHLHKLLVTSATYRQSARLSDELLARDPENRLLARGPRFRVDGEVVRDTALYLGGLLVEEIGGRSVRPYEPPGLWEAVSFNNSQKYIQDSGEAQYRRSLYTFWKRQSPPPNMLLFDAPSRESCTVRRSRSNTPLQALALLNDPQFVEASRGFAQRIMLEGGDGAESRSAYAFRLATARQPSSEELAIVQELFEEQLKTFRADLAAAESLLSVGTFVVRPDLDRAELAAWATVASLILNLDETLTKG